MDTNVRDDSTNTSEVIGEQILAKLWFAITQRFWYMQSPSVGVFKINGLLQEWDS